MDILNPHLFLSSAAYHLSNSVVRLYRSYHTAGMITVGNASPNQLVAMMPR